MVRNFFDKIHTFVLFNEADIKNNWSNFGIVPKWLTLPPDFWQLILILKLGYYGKNTISDSLFDSFTPPPFSAKFRNLTVYSH